MINKITKKAFKPIDQKEKDLMESIERDEWRPAKNFGVERTKAIEAARNTLKKITGKDWASDWRVGWRSSSLPVFFGPVRKP